MKIKVYFRVGKGEKRVRLSASTKPNYAPFQNAYPYNGGFQPTVWFSVILNLPEDVFDFAEKEVGKMNIDMKDNKVTKIALSGIKDRVEEAVSDKQLKKLSD